MTIFGPEPRLFLRSFAILLAIALLVFSGSSIAAFAQESPAATAPAPTAESPTPTPVVTPPAPAPPAAETAAAAPAAAPSPAGAYKAMTLWDMVKSGGVVMMIIIALSVVALGMAIYFMVTLTPNREVPIQFVKRAQAQIRAGDLRGAYQMCEDRDEFIANVLRAGLRLHGHDRYVVQEAMESEGERRAMAMWQKISYLNNIGVLAPLLGLLGTVISMIGAFGAIAYNDAQSRSLAMADNVAKAMVNTAAGLALAIMALIFYYYLRGRVVTIIAHVEAHSSEFVELITGKGAPE
ncbi:MAG: MotA/TolQ/ExbB proton channel family protein [Candidatus Hydrogenedentes bacterium]|nr:MotA/TolQ/ExbB proton channel family protein [Candidatus Hydrogenedentota bacterium]